MSNYLCFVGHLVVIQGADFTALDRISCPNDGSHPALSKVQVGFLFQEKFRICGKAANF